MDVMPMSIRFAYTLGFLLIVFLLLTGFYVQYGLGVIPCPLCIMQRIVFAALGILFLIGALFYVRVLRFFIHILAMLCSAAGFLLAGRQIWLQHFPASNESECMASLQYMFNALPLQELIQKLFSGTVECSERHFQLLYFNIAEWSFIWFVGLFAFSLCLFIEEIRNNKNHFFHP
jgi:protein dithiol:quinone oxidoreductase